MGKKRQENFFFLNKLKKNIIFNKKINSKNLNKMIEGFIDDRKLYNVVFN